MDATRLAVLNRFEVHAKVFLTRRNDTRVRRSLRLFTAVQLHTFLGFFAFRFFACGIIIISIAFIENSRVKPLEVVRVEFG
jgi:hypothetical protein